MSWYKHEVGMFDDRKVKKLRRKCGFTGYGLWCFILEQIAKEGTLCRLSPDYTIDDISVDTGLDIEIVKTTVQEMANITLIHKDLYEQCGIVCVPQFVRYYDEYHQRKNKKSVGLLSGQHHDSIGVDREIDRKIDSKIDNINLLQLAQQDPTGKMTEALNKIGYGK